MILFDCTHTYSMLHIHREFEQWWFNNGGYNYKLYLDLLKEWNLPEKEFSNTYHKDKHSAFIIIRLWLNIKTRIN